MAVAAFIGIALAAAAAPPPKWVVLETLPDGVIYIDPGSIRRQGSVAEMTVLIDYAKPQPDRTGKQIRSDTLHYRYDCAGRQESITSSSAHAGAMAGGAIVDTNTDPPRFSPVAPGTPGEKMLVRACGLAR